MVYNYMGFLNLPWDLIIEHYDDILKGEPLNTLQDYVERFTDFICNDEPLLEQVEQDLFIQSLCYSYLTSLEGRISSEFLPRVYRGESVDTASLSSKSIRLMKNDLKYLQNSVKIEGLPKGLAKQFGNKYSKIVKNVIRDLHLDGLNEKATKMMFTVIARLITRIDPAFDARFRAQQTGIVFAGYGKTEVFPRFRHICIQGIVNGTVRWIRAGGAEHDIGEKPACVKAFAQRQIIETFLSGISPDFQDQLVWLITKPHEEFFKEVISLPELEDKQEMLTEKLHGILKIAKRNAHKSILDFAEEHSILPSMGVMATFSVAELCQIAEALVSLTALKAKMYPATETVGGPIDVAVITRSGGFQWVKRKPIFGEPNESRLH